MKQRTTAKTIRIPNDTIDDIAKTAKEKHSSFSKEVNRRLHFPEAYQYTYLD